MLASKKLFTQLLRHCSSSEVSAASSTLFTQFLKQLFVNSCICIWTLCLEFSVSKKDVISCFSESLRLPKSLADTLDIVEDASLKIARLLVCLLYWISPSSKTSYQHCNGWKYNQLHKTLLLLPMLYNFKRPLSSMFSSTFSSDGQRSLSGTRHKTKKSLDT